MTDGAMYYSPDGEALKRFHTQDAAGLALARKAGIEIAWISADDSAITAARARKLGSSHVAFGCHDKVATADLLRTQFSASGATRLHGRRLVRHSAFAARGPVGLPRRRPSPGAGSRPPIVAAPGRQRRGAGVLRPHRRGKIARRVTSSRDLPGAHASGENHGRGIEQVHPARRFGQAARFWRRASPTPRKVCLTPSAARLNVPFLPKPRRPGPLAHDDSREEVVHRPGVRGGLFDDRDRRRAAEESADWERLARRSEKPFPLPGVLGRSVAEWMAAGRCGLADRVHLYSARWNRHLSGPLATTSSPADILPTSFILTVPAQGREGRSRLEFQCDEDVMSGDCCDGALFPAPSSCQRPDQQRRFLQRISSEPMKFNGTRRRRNHL